MKKLFVFVFITAILTLSILPVAADTTKDLVIDNADLLTVNEEKELGAFFAEIGDEWDYDIVVYTVDAIGVYSAHIYAERFFDDNGYGRGENSDGAILLISMEERDWGVFATDMSDSEAAEIGENITPYLSDGDYFSAFEAFAEEIDEHKSFPFFNNLIIALVVGFVIALIVVTSMKNKLKSVARVDHAREYVRKDSFKLSHSRDLYLYSTVTRIAKPKNTSSGGRGGGGGSRGGGASGKF